MHVHGHRHPIAEWGGTKFKLQTWQRIWIISVVYIELGLRHALTGAQRPSFPKVTDGTGCRLVLILEGLEAMWIAL